MFHNSAVAFGLLGAASLLAQSGPGGRIFGTVLDAAGGKPVAGLGLTLKSQANGTQSAGFRPLKFQTRSTREGRFLFDLLPPGRYRVCLDATIDGGAAGEFLNPCTWTPETTVVNIAVGSQAQMNLSLTRGVTLTIRVDDPGKHLDKNQGKNKDADFDLGFLTPQKAYQSARLRSKKVDEQVYEIQLPAGVAHPMLASSKFFDLEDDRGPQSSKEDGLQQRSVQALERTSLVLHPPEIVVRVKGLKGK